MHNAGFDAIVVVAAAVVAGVLAWSLAEYALHRVLGHDVRTRPNPFASEHVRHHAEGGYFAPSWKKALVALAVVPCAGGVAAVVVGDVAAGFAFGASFAAMYVAYERLHRRLHTHAGAGRFGRLLRRHHFHHHFEDPAQNHGVTSPVWDLVFRTRARPGVIHVPRKLAMPWLLDDHGAVRPEFAAHYIVR